jgi:uncharacterized heparinase superfamily protein
MSDSPTLQRFLTDTSKLFTVPAPVTLGSDAQVQFSVLSAQRFDFYGEVHDLGASIDWNINPGTSHWGHDLNRFSFLMPYRPGMPQDDVQVMLSLILDWIGKNDQKRYGWTPYAWGNLLNVATRIQNWWRFLDAATQAGDISLDAETWRTIALSVYRQTLILLRLIRTRGYNDNWSIIGLRGVLYILCAAENFPHRQKLIDIAWSGIDQAVRLQILPDGAQQELSPLYHWVVAELLDTVETLAGQAALPQAGRLQPTIGVMVKFLAALRCPDGGIVGLGDSDAALGPRINAFVTRIKVDHPLADEPSDPAIAVFPYAGLAIVRHRTNGCYLCFDGGPFGTAHQHEDALGFWWAALGVSLVVDPGRYLYELEPESCYTYLRSTRAHSTIRVDGLDQNARAAPELWRRAAPGGPDMTRLADGGTRLSGQYRGGYGPDQIGVIHSRDILVSADGLTLTIDDHLANADTSDQAPGQASARLIEQNWQIAPSVWSLGGDVFTAVRDHVEIRVAYDAARWQTVRVACGETAPFGGWYSAEYNKREPAPQLCLNGTFTLPVSLRTVLTARRVDAA